MLKLSKFKSVTKSNHILSLRALVHSLEKKTKANKQLQTATTTSTVNYVAQFLVHKAQVVDKSQHSFFIAKYLFRRLK